MTVHIERVQTALRDLQQGKMVILSDDPERENEGDLIIPADIITTEQMNFMIRQGTGIVCLSLRDEHVKKLQLPLMVPREENSSLRGTPFTLSIDAARGISTGVSALDRVNTIRAVMNEHCTPADIVKPGHVFPLLARDGGVLERRGHTEGAIDLVQLAGFKPAAVICEIMNSDGTMACGESLSQFAKTHQLNILSIEDIVNYRLYHESLLESESSAELPLEKYGTFNITVFKEKYSHLEHVVLTKHSATTNFIPLVRIHSSCLTGDLFTSQRCDCNDQLHYSLKRISQEGGMLIYLSQEGRGIGLFNKIRAYALQEQGYDTVTANLQLGLPVDARKYFIAAHILRKFQFDHIRLLTSNANKINDLHKYGIQRVDLEPMPTFQHAHNQLYLQTKNENIHTLQK